MVSRSRLLKRVLPALVAVMAFSVVGVASAHAEQHWYVGGSKLAAGTPAEETMTGVKTGELVKTKEGWVEKPSWTMTFNYVGTVEITCTGQSGTGSVENPLGGAAGLGESGFVLSGCKVATPSNCSVRDTVYAEWGTIHFRPLHEEATEVAGKSAVRFSSLSGTITTLKFGNVGGKNCFLSPIQLELYGSFTGVQESGSTLTFSETSPEFKYVGGYPVFLAGKSTLASGASALSLAF